MLAKNLGAVDEKRSQVFVPLHKAQFRAAKHRHIAPLGVQVIHRWLVLQMNAPSVR